MPPIRSAEVKAVRISSDRCTPSARPAVPESSPSDDWIWNALDTALNAAMTNDLPHSPSIKGIADVFTRMLGRLHGMKRNRDDFRVITNEIASLIESVVRYARERDPVCDRYKGVCDNFLSTISTMQSEMEQILGIPTKHSPKAKAYRTILSSYQFQVGSLRRDLLMINEVMRQELTLSSPVPSSTGLLSNSLEVTISGGTFTEIHGNQYQYIFQSGGTADTQTSLDGMIERMDDLDFSDYRVLKYGDLRAINTPDVDEQDPFQEYTVTIHNQPEIMTARTYRGKSALQSFKNDAKMILEYNFRHQHLAQLFGVCLSSKVPTLIFHGERERFPFLLNITRREYWLRAFQLHGELQAAFRYLMQKLQLGHLTSPYMQLTSEGQFLRDVTYIQQETRELYCMLPQDANFDNCSCHIYVDDYQRLQVSIEPVKRRTDLNSIILFPKLSLHDTEAMKHALLSNGIKPDGYQIDKKVYLLAIYRHIIWLNYGGHSFLRSPQESSIMLISSTRRARAVRLTFNHEYRFTWHGWSIDNNGSDVEVSQVAIDNISWTCFTIPHNVSSGQQAGHPAICCRSTFTPPSSYLETFLAQGERMLAQIRLLCATCRDVEIVAGVNCKIFFQSCFSPTSPFPAPQAVFLYVKDLQDVDDAFEISWFWAMDRKGLKRLSPADMCVLGLGELHQSKIYVDTWELRPQMWEELRVFHEIFGFAADSPDIPRFLDLPVASVEWDGGEDGPLTPWETITLNKRLRLPSGRIATTYSEDRTIFSQ